MITDKIHPDVRKAMEAVQLPEVQEMMQGLAKYGLAIVVPHLHDEDGNFLPLPEDMVQLEDGLQVSFKKSEDPEIQDAIAVAWRSQIDGTPTAAGKCVMVCKSFSFCGHHGVHRYRKANA